MRIVVDTNVLMSAIFWAGVPGKILQAWRAGTVRMVLSPPIVDEYRRTAAELSKKYSSITMDRILDVIVTQSELFEPVALPGQVCSDPDDDKFIACALAAKAMCIVSGDRALLATNGYRGVVVITPKRFVDSLTGGPF